MKTITLKENGISLYLFADDVALDVNDERIVVGDPVKFIIGDCNATNVDIHENVSDPGAWCGWKYFYDGQAWTLNPEWVDPASLR